MTEYKHAILTGSIIGCAMRVHATLGNGFQEVIYQRAMAMELRNTGLDFHREHEVEISYHGIPVGTRRADFIVDGIVLVELKAMTVLEDVHFAQAINYLEAYNLEVCLLSNFGAKRLEFRRFVHTPTV